MRPLKIRSRIMHLIAIAAFAAFVLSATAAFAATPGADIPSAVQLNSYFGSSFTTSLAMGSIAPTGHFYTRAYLTSGQTLSAKFQPGAGVVNGKALVLPLKDGYRIVESSQDASGVSSLNFMAPATGMYTVYYATSSPGTFTLSPKLVSATSFSMSSFSAPTSAKRYTYKTLSVKLTRPYNGPTSPISFEIQKKTGSIYKSYSTLGSTYHGYSTYSKFDRSVKFTSTGTYRVRARFRDAAHTKYAYTSWKTIKVY